VDVSDKSWTPGPVGDAMGLMVLPLLLAPVLAAAFAGCGTRRWFGGRADERRGAGIRKGNR